MFISRYRIGLEVQHDDTCSIERGIENGACPFDAMRKNADAIPHMQASAQLASFDLFTCEVVESISEQ